MKACRVETQRSMVSWSGSELGEETVRTLGFGEEKDLEGVAGGGVAVTSTTLVLDSSTAMRGRTRRVFCTRQICYGRQFA